MLYYDDILENFDRYCCVGEVKNEEAFRERMIFVHMIGRRTIMVLILRTMVYYKTVDSAGCRVVLLLVVPPDRDTSTCSKYCSLRRRQQEQKHQRNDDLNNSCFPIIS